MATPAELDDCLEGCYVDHDGQRFVLDPKLVLDEIVAAVAAERERCAKIAEGWHPVLYAPELGGSHPRDSAIADAKQGIAQAIRTQE